MKNLFYLVLLSAVLFATACQPPKKNTANEGELIRPIATEIEKFGDSEGGKEFVDYIYEKNSDFFWTKAIYKDSTGNVLKEIVRELDKNRLPIKETITELDIVSGSTVLKYDPETYFLLEKTVYDGEVKPENKKSFYKYTYSDGVIMAQEVERYSSNPDFRNSEGNNIVSKYKLRFVPAKANRPVGDSKCYYYLEYSKDYLSLEDYKEIQKDKSASKEDKALKPGQLYINSKTTFDNEGYPTYIETTRPDCEHDANRQWFKVDKDAQGRLIAITGYANPKMDSLTDVNSKVVFEYDANGMLSKFDENKYNPATKTFDRFHDGKTFVWNDLKLGNIRNAVYNESAVLSEHYCYGAIKYSVVDKKVTKFTKNMITVEESVGGYDGPLAERKADKKIKMISTTKFKTIK